VERAQSAAAAGLERARLLQALDGSARLVLVVAPAGYGKTTLLAQHAARRDGRVAWLRVTPEDGDRRHLLASAERALLRAAPVPAPARDGHPAHDLGPLLDGTTLVVDDAHLIIDSPGEAELERMLTDGPPEFRVLLAARRAPGLNLARAELGQPVLLTAEDLRFRSWEVEELFRHVYREPLPPDDVAALARRTEGWAACLQLFHLSTQSRPLPERRRAVRALTGGARFARSYLARTVLDELPGELREFMARTAPFEVLTPERCDRLLETSDARDHLAELERLGALTSSDDDGSTYRYHEVLRRHLESALRAEVGAEAARGWYRRAADILVQDGAPAEAVRACLRADLWDHAVRLLHRERDRAVDAVPGPPWDDVLPVELVDEDPWLSTALARRNAAAGRLAAAAARYRRAEELFPDPVDRERTARERRLVELWSGGRPQPHLHWLDRIRAAVARQPGTPGPADPHGPGDLLAEAVSAVLVGDLASAGAPLQQILAAEAGDEAEPTARNPSLLFLAARLLQALMATAMGASAVTEADRIAADAERLGAAWFVRQARVLHGLGRGDTDELARIRAECAAVEDAWGALLADGAAELAGLAAGSARPGAFLALAERCAEAQAGTLRAWALAAAALAAAARGEPVTGAVRVAEQAARSAGVWGVQALTALALAPSAPDPHQAVFRAHAIARVHGLPWPERLAGRLVGPAEQTPAAEPPPTAGDAAAAAAADAPGPVRLRCLGRFELEVAGRPVDWSGIRPRAASALRLLALHAPRPVHRDTLLQLWPALPDEQATHSLQVAVSSLRALLVPDAPRGSPRMLPRTGDTYALILPPGSSVDVVDFDAELADAERARSAGAVPAETAALQRAVTLYRGELLPEEGAAEWVVRERDRLRLRAAAACARLAEVHLQAGEPAEAATVALRGVEIDPYDDGCWTVLIRASERLGNTAAAARARREYLQVLRELGVPARRARPAPSGSPGR
jgi:DNA-binding SARP family transcriptional activator